MAKEKKKKNKKEKDLIKLNADSEIIKTNDEEIAKEKKKEKNKENRENIKKSFSYYKFIIKIIAAILLITFGIVILVNQQDAIFPIMFAIGGVTLLVAIIRLIANLIKKDLDKKQKTVLNVVSLVHLLFGIYLIIGAFLYNANKGKYTPFDDFNAAYYPLFLAIILYVESIGYFMNAILNKLNSSKFMFWLHIVYVTLSVAAAASIAGMDNAGKQLIIGLAVIIFICALLVGGEAIGGYFNFRNGINKEKAKDKEKEDNKEDTIEAPASDDNKDIIIPTDDNNDDRPIVN